MRQFALLLLGSAILAGCGSAPSADPEVAKRTATAAPKTASELPSSMPPEAKASAAAAIGQAKAEQDRNSDPARVKAMQMMKQQHGG